ncbi:MAG: hypothetical protein CMI79_05715 [Candidatus Pelagibacter sp.]|nr:hypothetical protein [Candidatus Pelagibacter sp.]|tara:strand:+ start:17814 stop:18800 length:987 start_codon:yes stop_codon:yes gene_type:complete
MSKIKIICTLGPASYKNTILNKLKKYKVDIFRINLSHTPKNKILQKIKFLKKKKIKNICIDTEGAQVRTTKVKKKLFFNKNQIVKVFVSSDLSDRKKICLYPKFNLFQCKVNSKIKLGFNNLALNIIKKDQKNNVLVTKVSDAGYLESNKAVHFSQNIKLPPLTEKDEFALKLAIKNGIKFFAMSFVNRSKDIQEIREIIKKKNFLISKIETKSALTNLKEISKKSNALLIDRGDLSRYVPIEEIPVAQEKIIEHGLKNSLPVYVATNLLETMIKEKQPTRAESHDIFSTLKQGASGLVLAAETAIGRDPVGCVMFMKKAIKVFKKNT